MVEVLSSARQFVANHVLEFFWVTIVGVPGAVLSSYIYKYLEANMADRKNKLDIKGTWGEFVPTAHGRRFSFGKIYFDPRRKMYRFDGTNYYDSGEKFCHWETVTSHFDLNNKKFFYLFTAQLESELETTYYGFGVVNLAEDDCGDLSPVDGHYVSASVEDKPKSHSMHRFADVDYHRGANGRSIVEMIKSREEATSTPLTR
jgi:hypothetical protein